MAYNTTASWEKLACTDYVDFGKCQDSFGRISWSKNSFDYLDVKLKVFKRDENKQFRLAQNLTMGEASFNQFIRLRNQLVVAVRDFSKEENLPLVQVKLLAKEMEEQLKLTHKVVEVVDRQHRKLCVTVLRYNVEKPENSYVQVRLSARRKDEEKFNHIVYVIHKLDVFIYLLDVMNSVYDKVIANELACNVLYQGIATIQSLLSFSFYLSQNDLEHWRKHKPISYIEIKIGILSCCTNNTQKFSRKTTLTLVEMQQLPEIEKVDSKNEIPCLKWTIYNSRRNVCISFKTDMDKLNIVVYRYRNNTYVKDTEMELKLTEYEKLLSKRVYLLIYIDVFFKRCIVLDETTVHK